MPAEVAQQLRTGKHYVYRRISDGTLPVINIGSDARPKFRIRQTDLDAFIESFFTPPPPDAGAG